MKRVLSIVGARPQFMKLAAVEVAVRNLGAGLEHLTLHTGQHYDDSLSGVFFRDLGLARPDIHLRSGSGSHGVQTGKMLAEIEEAVSRVRPDLVLVYGDTNTTVAGALASKKLGVPVGHVEAGVRSRDRWAPEEINRRVTDVISDWLFAPTDLALSNLANEGFRTIRTDSRSPQLPLAVNTGDVMYDTFLRVVDGLDAEEATGDRPFVLATVHRAENTDSPERLQAILGALGELARRAQVCIPLHPRTAEKISKFGLQVHPGVQVQPPLPYREMLRLERDADVILTDSGGVQREAYWLGTPCVTVLDDTCWPETIADGWNILTPASTEAIVDRVQEAIDCEDRPSSRNAFGDGHAAERIVQLCAETWTA